MAQGYKELIVWQLADELRRKIIQMTSAPEVKKDFRFVSDIRGSARSVPSNIAEGHGRFNPGEFHRFLEFASGSLEETENHLQDGLTSSYFTKEDHAAAHLLIRRLTAAKAPFMRYLRSEQAKLNAQAIRKRQNPGPVSLSELLCVGHNMRSCYAWQAPQATERAGTGAGSV